MSLDYWRGKRLDAMSRTDLISAILHTQAELDAEKNGEAFRDRVLSQIQPFPSPFERIKLSGIKLSEWA